MSVRVLTFFDDGFMTQPIKKSDLSRLKMDKKQKTEQNNADARY